MPTSFWVDTESGTYGKASNIKVITFSDDQQALVEAFENGSDSYRIEAAFAWGEFIN